VVDDLADGGSTVFLTSHSMAGVEALADRVGVLVEGRLADVGSQSALLAAHGAENRLHVETDAADAVGSTLAGHDVVRTDRGVRVDGVEPGEIGSVVEALTAAGVDFDAITWREPDLESVYLSLAGESLRELTPGQGGATR
jgi:ABC-2 type transport system ATP-binding protein